MLGGWSPESMAGPASVNTLLVMIKPTPHTGLAGSVLPLKRVVCVKG